MTYPYLQGLNPSQYEAVVNTQGPSLVIAGAGSGKTRVLTFRIAHLLRTGAHPASILALTFTNKAAREMKDRIASVVGGELARHLWMGTFHSIFARILRIEAEHIGFSPTFTIYDTSDSKSLIRSILKSMELSDKIYKVNTVLSRISAAKNNLITASAYAASPGAVEYDFSIKMPKISEIYKEYSRRCKVSDAMDFDDLLMNTNLLLHQNPEVLKKYQQRFAFILVDEYQDTNFAQYLIVKKLAELHRNICVVGDDAQSIYAFRGARIENILNFRNDYPEFKTFKLEQNYRSTQNIVNAANSIIQKNKRQLKKTVFSENEPGEPIRVIEALTDNEEGQLVVSELNEFRLTHRLNYSDFAILYRTNAQSRIFEEQLRKINAPYRIYGGLSFYERKEIKDMLAYLRMIVNTSDSEALKRIINYPARGIGDTTIGKIEAEAATRGVSMWEILLHPEHYQLGLNKGTLAKIEGFIALMNQFKQQLTVSTAYELTLLVARQTGLLDDLYKDKTPENLSKFENVQELLNAVQDFSINALEEGRPNRLEDYLQEVALLTDQDTDKSEDKNRVTLMTVHSAKGLEFKYVFIVGMEEKLFPSNFSGFLTPDDLEEERRLFYVAMTRAMKRAWLSFARQRYNFGKLNFCEPSRFIGEIDQQFLIMPSDHDRPTFIGRGMFRDYQRPEPLPAPERQVAPPVRKLPDQAAPMLNKRLLDMKQAMSRPAFNADDPALVDIGQWVEHQRYGRGKVLEVEGTDQSKKAVVLFQNAGRKQLLLKYAGLKIVDESAEG